MPFVAEIAGQDPTLNPTEERHYQLSSLPDNQTTSRDGDGYLATQKEERLARQLSTLREHIQNIYIYSVQNTQKYMHIYRNLFLANEKVGKLLLIAHLLIQNLS